MLLRYLSVVFLVAMMGCESTAPDSGTDTSPQILPKADFTLSADQTHNRFSATIPPALTVPSGAVIEAFTEEATDQQLSLASTTESITGVSFDPIHPITGPVYVEGAQPGDILAVKLLDIEVGDWGWTGVFPGFGFLADQFTEPYLKTFDLSQDKENLHFNERIAIPLQPFPGVMGVAPATDSLLSTIPPRANGGNMDNRYLTTGTTVYFPVFVDGALFSIGDAHAVQGMGEVCGTAVEAPMKILYQVDVIKSDRILEEPEYETEQEYAVTAFGTTLDEAARKATAYMVDYLTSEYGLSRNDAYLLCSLAGDLKIAEVVDVPHVLVAMHMSKQVLGM